MCEATRSINAESGDIVEPAFSFVIELFGGQEELGGWRTVRDAHELLQAHVVSDNDVQMHANFNLRMRRRTK